MADHNDLGKKGEAIAVDFLEKNHYTILETNWVFQKAEIDIIAQKDNQIVVVEVKTRSSTDFGLPQDFVKPAKIKLLVKAIDAYINLKNITNEVRFDIIAIQNVNNNFDIEHIQDAFFYF